MLKRIIGALIAILLSAAATVAFADNVQVQILSAVIKDQRIPGAQVIIQKNGASSASGTTDERGAAALNTEFADGSDTLVIVKKKGYSNLVAKCPCKGMTYALSPVMTNLDGLRIVLNWGGEPLDLDSHLAFGSFHVFYGQKDGGFGAYSNGEGSATWGNPQRDVELDVDDTDGFGPETITIKRRRAGESYVYAVHNFADASHPDSNTLAQSHAKVLVYIGQSLVRSYYVPNHSGNIWTVFRITPEGEFQDINTMEGQALTPVDVVRTFSKYLKPSAVLETNSLSLADEEDAVALNKKGEQAYHAGNIEESIELYRQAIDIAPNYGQAYSNLGLAHAKMGHTAEAIWANRKAIALASGPAAATVRASSYYNIAKIYESAGEYSNALQQYESAKRERSNPVYDKAIERVRGLMGH